MIIVVIHWTKALILSLLDGTSFVELADDITSKNPYGLPTIKFRDDRCPSGHLCTLKGTEGYKKIWCMAAISFKNQTVNIFCFSKTNSERESSFLKKKTEWAPQLVSLLPGVEVIIVFFHPSLSSFSGQWSTEKKWQYTLYHKRGGRFITLLPTAHTLLGCRRKISVNRANRASLTETLWYAHL